MGKVKTFTGRAGWVALTFAVLAGTAVVPVSGRPAEEQGGGGRGGQQGAGRAGQARDLTQQPLTGTGGISGSVTTAGSGAPVRRARVILSGAGQRSTTTDDQGRFAFASLPAGRFTMSASKAGYVNMTYGAKKPGRAGTPIQLAEGQKLDKASITLPKGSVLTGIVVDENGDPSPGTQVRALKFTVQRGEKTLQQVSSDTTDDRGMYRIYALQPGDYLVSAVPRNQGLGDAQQGLMMEIESLLAQAQMGGGRGGGQGGGGRGGGGGAAALAALVQGGGGGAGGGRVAQQLLDRAAQLQSQLQQQEQAQNVGYAPVYYPGTTTAPAAQTVMLNLSEERSNIDFQLRLVPMVKVEGTISGPDGPVQGAQIRMMPSGQSGFPTVPGLGENSARADATGKFAFNSVTPGAYTILASAPVRDPNAQAQAAGGQPGQLGPGRGGALGQGGPGGRGGRGGQVVQVLWASTEVSVSGINVTGVALSLQPGMTVSGRIVFEPGTAQAPTDLTAVRVVLSPTGAQSFDMGPAMTQSVVDATGQFKITGVSPGRYTIRANVAGAGRAQAGGGQAFGAAGGQAGAAQAAGRGGAATGGAVQGGAAGGRAAGAGTAGTGGTAAAGGAQGQQAGAQPQTNAWTLKSATFGGRDALDFSLEIRPNEDATGTLTFTDKRQELSGTIQDSSGRPTSDYTIIVFPQENQYWVPNSRRIAAPRPTTDGKFTVNNLPPGLYRLTAVTDAEPDEWYDPAFLSQLIGVSIPVTIQAGEKKVQDIKVAGGGRP